MEYIVILCAFLDGFQVTTERIHIIHMPVIRTRQDTGESYEVAADECDIYDNTNKRWVLTVFHKSQKKKTCRILYISSYVRKIQYFSRIADQWISNLVLILNLIQLQNNLSINYFQYKTLVINLLKNSI